MITPRFKLSQDETNIHFWIRAPYCNLRELEVSVEDEVFVFTCKPYHLRLHMPGKLLDEFSNTSFDTDKGEFEFDFKKANPGEHFEDLDLITKLLCPKVEVIEGERKVYILSGSDSSAEGDPDYESHHKYGFAMLGNYSFKGLSSEFGDVFEVDPIEVDLVERKKLRLSVEQGKFDGDYYLADFFEDASITELMALEAPWSTITSVTFTDEELDFLKDLTNVEYNLTQKQITYCHNSLIDILYAYCYDRRTTNFEGTVESSWTIVKLAASLCWLDGFETPKEALVSAHRRSLIFPLYRSYKLSEKILEDLKQVLKLDEKYIIKCLIEIHNLFLAGDCCRYVLNNLFIRDYIRYVMKWDKDEWRKVIEDVGQITIRKEDLGLNLKELEKVAQIDSLMSSLEIVEDDSDDSSDDGSSSDSVSSSYVSGSSGSESDSSD